MKISVAEEGEKIDIFRKIIKRVILNLKKKKKISKTSKCES